MCPYCRRAAPIVMEGLVAYCTACGHKRSVLSGAPIVNLAGRPARVGGALARLAGWLVLGVGVLLAILVGGLLHALGAAVFGWILATVLATMAVAAAVAMLRGGRALDRRGLVRAGRARLIAARSFAATHGGRITADEAARAFGDVTREEADGVLMGLVRNGEAEVEVDEQTGAVAYRLVAAPRFGEPMRVRPANLRVEDAFEDDDDARDGERRPLRVSHT